MAWFEQLREAIRLYNEGHDAERIARVKSILSGALSPYPRVRCRVLLAYALDDWYEAEWVRFEAENSWTHWRTFWPVGRSARTDRLLEELRTRLDELAEEMRQTRPDDWVDHQLIWNDIDAQDREAELDEALEEYAAELAEGEQEEAAEDAEGQGEGAAERAEAQEEGAAEDAEGKQEEAAEEAETKEEEAAEQAEALEEQAAEEAEALEDEQAVGEVETNEEQAAEIAEAEEEEAAELAEGETEAEAERAEAEAEGWGDLPQDELEALYQEADLELDDAARERAQRSAEQADTPASPLPAEGKKKTRATRIPQPTAASGRSPRNVKPIQRFM